MRHLTPAASLLLVVGCSSAPEPTPSSAPPADVYVEDFAVDPHDWASRGKNPCFVLEPGYGLVLEGKEKGKPVRLVVTVLDKTQTIDGVETRVVEEREWEDGELAEVSRNYFAISKKDRAVYYFGEDVDEYEDGKVTGHEGSWRSGVNGARFGLMMPGAPAVGMRWRIENAPGVAMDKAEVVSVTETIDVEGKRADGVRIQETNDLEKGATEFKTYAPGVGLVQDGPCKLVRHGMHLKKTDEGPKKKGKKKKAK